MTQLTKLARPDVVMLVTFKNNVERETGQMFYETPRTWELWHDDDQRPIFLRLWRKQYVYWSLTLAEMQAAKEKTT